MNKTTDDLVQRIAADFTRQLEDKMIDCEMSRIDLARHMGLTPGRITQILSNPGNLTLRNIAQYSKALGLKVTVVTYEAGGEPIRPEVFRDCWLRAGKPRDYLARRKS